LPRKISAGKISMTFTESELAEFKAEARELLDVAERSLLSLDKGGDYRGSFDAIFRSLHNLKGAAGMMELLQLQSHMHELESILMTFKDASSLPIAHVSFFLRGVDGARILLEGEPIDFSYEVDAEKPVGVVVEPPATPVDSKNEGFPIGAIDEFLSESDEIIDRVSNRLRAIESGDFAPDTLNEIYRDVHSLKGAAFLFGYLAVGNLAHAMESSLEPVREGTVQPSKALVDMLFKSVEWIEREFIAIRTNAVSLASVDQSKSLIENLLATSGPTQPSSPMQNPTPPLSTPPPPTPPDSLKEKETEGPGSIRVPVALLDNLMTLMGEMVLVRNQVLQFSSTSEDLEFLNLSKRLNVVTSEIQGEMMKTRMQPIGNILGKFHRVVRDLSQELKKNITLTLSGAETEVDKSLLEAIKDPLTHIIRNSCDHGIEIPGARTASGKSDNGSIGVRSYHEGGQVVIEVTDDGKGLHKEVLVAKAIEKGILTPVQAAALNEKEIYGLIFAPGFSTAASVTNVSGRGVGMDVVRTNIERIGGTVELSSVPGKGTTTRLKIPLTLAIVPALIVRCGRGAFAIPQVKLEELVRVDSSSSEAKIEYLHGTPVYRLRGRLLPLVDLNRVLGLESKGRETGTVSNIAVVNGEQCSFGLIIDEVQDTADIVVKPLTRLLKSLQVYSGATILGDGSIALILDVSGISKVTGIGNEHVKPDETFARTSAEKRVSNLQEFLVVRLNSPTKHALVLNYVHRLEEFRRADIELSGEQRVIRYGNSILPILSVSERLGYPAALASDRSETLSVVVIEKAGTLFGLEVEEIVDTLSTELEVDTTLVRKAGFFGNLNLPDGLIVGIDPFEIINGAFPELEVKAVTDEATRVATAKVAGPREKKSLRILFVEDTVFFRRAVSIVLEKEGHQLSVAVDGREALDLLEKSPTAFDLVISDIEMPKMNGFELAEAVRANPALAHLPLLALSSRADHRHSERGLRAGFNIYLEKLKPALLVEAIAEVTQSGRRAA
jgi:two-component system chemotaxis sensor kinase CheA